jgi:hypothetical protein
MNSLPLQRRTLHKILFLIVLSAFMADVVDLREELRILPCLYSALDSNITAGVVAGNLSSEPKHLLSLFIITEKASAEISFLHLLPYSFRAPPFRS